MKIVFAEKETNKPASGDRLAVDEHGNVIDIQYEGNDLYFIKDRDDVYWFTEDDEYARFYKAIPKVDLDEISDPFEQGHKRCKVCGECITCNLRPCRDGKEHQEIFETDEETKKFFLDKLE